ncbi:conserved hypothetical protein [Neisseria meningitidis 053442]|nr:conserved hypothetical protein [Neisseria meningitidis 053442]
MGRYSRVCRRFVFPAVAEMGKVRMKLDGEDGLYGAAEPYRFEINLQSK